MSKSKRSPKVAADPVAGEVALLRAELAKLAGRVAKLEAARDQQSRGVSDEDARRGGSGGTYASPPAAKARRMPAMIPMDIVAKACGYSTDEARDLLVALGVATKVGHRWKASRSKLREKAPDVFEDVFASYEMPNSL